MEIKCPASMCPLIAPNGSPWTGEKDAVCPEKDWDKDENGNNTGCGFHGGGGCMACPEAASQVLEFEKTGRDFRLSHKQVLNKSLRAREYDCAREKDCKWQLQALPGLCPPRLALSKGIDPKVCLF